MRIIDLIFAVNGVPLRKSSKELVAIQNQLQADPKGYRLDSTWKIYHFHRRNNSFYQNFLKESGLSKCEEWASIPVMQKNDIQRPLVQLLSLGYSVRNVYKNNTSGSTGKPFHFAKDKFAHAMTWAYIIERYREIGLEYGVSKQARFFGIPLDKKGFLKETVKDYFSSRERFPVFDLSDQVLNTYLRRFCVTKFCYIYGYTSSLTLFAKFLLEKGVILKEVCPTIQCCIVTSEVCSTEDRFLLERSFGVKVVNEYGAAELDLIAFEDKDGDWIINEENLFVEVVDERNNPVPDGVAGNVVVTSLHNKAMPFIRYNLGDVAIIDPRRKGSYRILLDMKGRTNDVAILPSGKRSPGLTFYYVSKSLLQEGGFLKEFIIKQTSLDTFVFEYVSEQDLTEDQKNQVGEKMSLYLEPGLKCSFIRKERIERTKAGKFRHFQNLIGKS